MRSRRVRRVVTVRKGEQHVMQRRGGALGTERALIDGTARIAFHMNDLIVLRIDELRAADRAIGANAGADLIGFDEPLGMAGVMPTILGFSFANSTRV